MEWRGTDEQLEDVSIGADPRLMEGYPSPDSLFQQTGQTVDTGYLLHYSFGKLHTPAHNAGGKTPRRCVYTYVVKCLTNLSESLSTGLLSHQGGVYLDHTFSLTALATRIIFIGDCQTLNDLFQA